MSFTTAIKDLIKEDGGNDEIPQSEQRSSEMFNSQQDKEEEDEDFELPVNNADSIEAVYNDTGKPHMTTNSQAEQKSRMEANPNDESAIMISESLLEAELQDVIVQEPRVPKRPS